MKIKMMKVLNFISGVSFFLSAASLLVIPFIKYGQELPVIAYVVACFFWIGLIIGLILQAVLAVNCKRLSLKNESKKHRRLYIVSAVALAVVVILSLLNSKNIFVFSVSIFLLLLSLQAAVVIKREGCLK